MAISFLVVVILLRALLLPNVTALALRENIENTIATTNSFQNVDEDEFVDEEEYANLEYLYCNDYSEFQCLNGDKIFNFFIFF